MVKENAAVKSKTGLHARPLADLVKLCNEFESDITIEHKGNVVNAKDMLELLSASIECGESITIIANGNDEEKAIQEVANYINTREE